LKSVSIHPILRYRKFGKKNDTYEVLRKCVQELDVVV